MLKKYLTSALILFLLSATVMSTSAVSMKYNGGIYSGVISNGKMNGNGTYTKDSVTYIGTFKNNIITGKGVMISDGYRYEGTFVNGKLNSKVTIYRPDGYIIKDEPFKNGSQVNMEESDGQVVSTAVDEIAYISKNESKLSLEQIESEIDYILSINSQYYLAYIYKAKLYKEAIISNENIATEEAENIIEAANTAVRIDTNRPEAYYYKALVYHHVYKNFDKAVEYFQMCADRLSKCELNGDGSLLVDPYEYIVNSHEEEPYPDAAG